MARPLALRTEVVARLHEARAEQHLPVTIHRDARGEWMVRRDEPLGEGEAVRRHAFGQRRPHRRHARDDLLALHLKVSAHEDERVARRGHVFHHHRGGNLLGERVLIGLELGEVSVGTEQFLRVMLAEKLLQVRALLAGALLRGNGQQREVRRRDQRRDFLDLERAAVEARVVHRALKRRGVPASAEMQPRLRGQRAGRELVGGGIGRDGFPVDVELHAGGLAGAVVGHEEMEPRVLRQRVFTGNLEGIVRPRAGEMRVEFELVIHQQIHAAKLLRVVHPAQQRAALALAVNARPAAERKTVRALEAHRAPSVEKHLAVELQRAADAAADPDRRVGAALEDRRQRRVIRTAVVERPVQREASRQALRLLDLQRFGADFFLPLHLRCGQIGFDLLHQRGGGGNGLIQFRRLCRLLRRRHGQEGRRVRRARAVEALLRHLMEERVELVKLLRRDGIVFVVVALGATHRGAEPHGGRGAHAVHDVFGEILVGVRAALVVGHHVAVETARDLLRPRRVRQQIAGELLDGELVERQVPIERRDDPLAPRPHLAQAVVVIAARIRVTRLVEPRHRHALAVSGPREQAIHQLLVSVRALVREEGVHVRDARWQAGQVQRHAADERLAFCLGLRLQAVLLQAREDELVHRVHRPLRGAHFR